MTAEKLDIGRGSINVNGVWIDVDRVSVTPLEMSPLEMSEGSRCTNCGYYCDDTEEFSRDVLKRHGGFVVMVCPVCGHQGAFESAQAFPSPAMPAQPAERSVM